MPDTLVGRTMEILEALGLPEKQEISVKKLIKDVIYELVSDSERNVVYIHSSLHDAIRQKNFPSFPNPVMLEDVANVYKELTEVHHD